LPLDLYLPLSSQTPSEVSSTIAYLYLPYATLRSCTKYGTLGP
jgi:hypothetical protein